MEAEHKRLLAMLDNVVQELSKACSKDQSFNDLLSDLNEEQNVFGRSLDEYSISTFIEERDE